MNAGSTRNKNSVLRLICSLIENLGEDDAVRGPVAEGFLEQFDQQG